jgi:hypothetical protein
MRKLPLVLLIAVTSAFGDQPSTRRPLTGKESAALEEPTALGHRMLTALARYSKASEPVKIPTEFDVMTRTPTIELLHAAGYISDSDTLLSRRYRVVLQLIPAEAPPTRPLLTMQTDSGELIFDTRGNVTLRPHE